jgi:hypothetical protein
LKTRITGRGLQKRECVELWGRIFIHDFAYISWKFLSDPGLFSPGNEEISAPPPCEFLIGLYLLSENWSTESFWEEDLKKWAVCSTYFLSSF